MRGLDYWHKDWKCPFFKWDERQKVACEGRCVVSMPDRKSALSFMDRYCADLNGWRGCSIAKALLDYYDRKEAEG